MTNTLVSFLQRNLIFDIEKTKFLGVMSNNSQIKEMMAIVGNLAVEATIATAHFENTNSLVDLQSLNSPMPTKKKKIWMIGMPFEVFDTQWTQILTQQKLMHSSSEHSAVIVILNVYDVSSVYDVIPNLKDITTLYMNYDVLN